MKDQWEVMAELTTRNTFVGVWGGLRTLVLYLGSVTTVVPTTGKSLEVIKDDNYFSCEHPMNHSGVKGKCLEVVMVSVTLLREAILRTCLIFSSDCTIPFEL